MLNSTLQQTQTLATAGVARVSASCSGTGAAAVVTPAVYATTAHATTGHGKGFALRLAAAWSAITRKSMNVPAFPDPWPLCPT